MRRPDPRRARRLAGWGSALVAAALIATAVPATSSAFTASVTNSADIAASKAVFTCSDVFAADARRRTAYFQYSLREGAGAQIASDSSERGNDGNYDGANTKDTSAVRACPNDAGSPYLLDGSTSRVTTSKLLPGIRSDFSIEVWFKTPQNTTSEKIIGFESTRADQSSDYDKHVYIGSDGHLWFGIYPGGVQTLTSSMVVNDGLWHQAVATTSSSDGSALYIDGRLDRADTGMTQAQGYDGFWRVGQGRTTGWPYAPDSSSFTGDLTFAAAYGQVLSAGEVRSAYDIGKPAATAQPSGAATARPAATASPAPTATVAATPAATAVPDATPSPASSASQEPATTASQHPESTPTYIAPSQDPDISTAQ